MVEAEVWIEGIESNFLLHRAVLDGRYFLTSHWMLTELMLFVVGVPKGPQIIFAGFTSGTTLGERFLAWI